MTSATQPPASFGARVDRWISFGLAPVAIGFIIYLGAEMARGVPDAYREEHRSGLLLWLSLLSGSLATLTRHTHLRLAFVAAQCLSIAGLLYVMFGR